MKFKKEKCRITEKIVEVPDSLIYTGLGIPNKMEKAKPLDLGSIYTQKLIDAGILPDVLTTWLFNHYQRNATGKKSSHAKLALFRGLMALTQKHGAPTVNSAMEKDTVFTLAYVKGIIRNSLKESIDAVNGMAENGFKITVQNMMMKSIGTYIRSLSLEERKEIYYAVQEDMDPLQKKRFATAWKQWKQTRFDNQFKTPGIGLRRLVFDYLKNSHKE